MASTNFRKQFTLYCILLTTYASNAQQNYTQYVDPMIGTAGHGHTFPGATCPFGMVQLSPDTRVDGSWDGCSGYHYSDSIIYGFSHTHLSGTGCSDYGDIMLMPMMGEASFDNKMYASRFSHKTEKVGAGYYAVHLIDDDIDVELTSTARVGFHKYTFHKDGEANIILDLRHRDKLLQGAINFVNDHCVDGYRISKNWAQKQIVCYRIEFSKPFIDLLESPSHFPVADSVIFNAGNADCFSFNVKKGESIMIKVSLSPVDYTGAQANMNAELPGWDFDKIKKDADAAWNKELSKIEVTTDDKDKLKIFYTALYHTMIQPNIYNDVDHRYRGRDGKVHFAQGFDYYTVFSLWDTFRAAHPLYTIIDQKRTSDFINTFLAEYEQSGRLPVWELSSNETDCMIGYHSVSVIADAIFKGIQGFDRQKAFEACKHSALLDRDGLDKYKEKGYLDVEDENESVSKTLEYAYDDWCIAQMAELLNKKDDYDYFMKRSQSWKNVFDPETGFMRPRKNGGWLSPFDPKEVNNNFTEGNSWQYTFFVPQDIEGFIKRMGGPEKMEKKLDEFFTMDSKTTGREQSDITGLIGQYAHGNEPSHNIAYLYNYIGKPEKTQKYVKQIMNDFYKSTPDGLIGNEDCGQMSAWYVMSAMGLYDVCPGKGPEYSETSIFKKVKLNIPNAVIEYSMEKDVKRPAFKVTQTEGSKIDVPYYTHAFLFKAFSDTGKVVRTYGAYINNMPITNIMPAPIISTASKVFSDSLKVEIKSLDQEGKIYYSVISVGSLLAFASEFREYTKPFYISRSKEVYAELRKGNQTSETTKAVLFKRPNKWTIKLNSTYVPQYNAGGDEAIIDGLKGDVNWKKGGWQGYEGTDLECVIDLGKIQNIKKISAQFLQDQRAWIMMPKKVEYYTSNDGKNFKLLTTVENPVSDKDEDVQVRDLLAELKTSVNARYVKMKVINYGKLPAWHESAGEPAYIFIDEVTIE